MTVLYQQIYRDDKPASIPFEAGSSDVEAWFRNHVSYGDEGFVVRDLTGPYYVSSLGDVNQHTPGGEKLIAYADELGVYSPEYSFDKAESIVNRLNQHSEV